MMLNKKCTKCKILKSIDCFNKDKYKIDGLDCWCKDCRYIYRENNRDKLDEYAAKYREDNKEKIRLYHKKNAEKLRIYNINYRNKTGYNHEYYKKNRNKINARKRLKRKTDPIYRLNTNISCEIRNSLIDGKEGKHWEILVGYSIIDLKEHLESQFHDGMNWNNYGRNGWHLDHKIPISLFNIKSEKSRGFKRCWALDNLQPLWETDNIRKNNKIFV